MLDSNCFKRQSRLLNRAAFQAVFKEKKKYFGNGFILYSCQNSVGYPRMGVILSKKQVRLASHRNRVRRVIKESFRLNQSKLPDLDFVVVCLKKAETLKRKELFRCITEQWQKHQPELAGA